VHAEWETAPWAREAGQTWSFRGSKSRNKVSVGEPAEGSLSYLWWCGCALLRPTKPCSGMPVPPNPPLHTHCEPLRRRVPARACAPRPHLTKNSSFYFERKSLVDSALPKKLRQLSTTDLLALASMKNAAKCDK
jgi:hypothetical protein